MILGTSAGWKAGQPKLGLRTSAAGFSLGRRPGRTLSAGGRGVVSSLVGDKHGAGVIHGARSRTKNKQT